MEHLSQEGTVRIGTAAAIPVVLRSLGINPADILAEAGLDPSVFDDPDSIISYTSRSHLFELCVARTGCQHFGLRVGELGSLSSLGLVGYLAQHCIDVASALRSIVRHFHLHVQGAVVTLTVEDGLAFVAYNIYQPRVEATSQIGDGAVAIAFNIMRRLCGRDWKPVEVCFAHRRPIHTEPFHHLFQAPLRFDAEQNGLFFTAQWLTQPVSGADPELHRLLQKQIDQLEARFSDDFPEQVRRVLRTALLTHHATANQVAALFSIHSRTLNRRLSAFGTTFHELADEGRYEIARQMLEDSEIELSQITEVLDYTDISAFTRAFRRWSGTTPARWRAEQKTKRAIPAPVYGSEQFGACRKDAELPAKG